MAKIHDIDEKKKADRCTALFALNAAGDTEQSDCLTDDEMSRLVDSQCTPEEQDRYFKHLAQCEHCYRQWVELSELVKVNKTLKSEKTVRKLFQPRQLAWAGSALAAAASIVLFLNITRETLSPVKRQPMQTGVERSWAPAPGLQNDAEESDSRAKATEPNIDNMHDTVQPEMETQAVTPASAPVEKKSTSVRLLTKKPKNNSPALKEEVQVMGVSGGQAADGLPRKSAYQGRVQAREWIERIQQGCLSQQENIWFWGKQYLEGRKIIHYKNTEEQKLVQDLLPLIEQLQQPSGKSIFICRRILKRLETNAGR